MLFVRDVLRFEAKSKADRDLLKEFAVPNRSEARIIWVEGPEAWLIRLGTTRLVTWSMPTAKLKQMASSGAVAVLSDHGFDVAPSNDELTQTQIAYRDARFRWIAPLLEKRPGIFNRSTRTGLVTVRIAEVDEKAAVLRQLASERPDLKSGTLDRRTPNRRLINELLRRYWAHGMTPNAITPRFDLIGGEARTAPRKRRVQRSKAGAKLRPFVTPAWRDTFDRAINLHYRRNAHKSLKRVWQQVVDDATAKARMTKDAEVVVTIDEHKRLNEVPTYRQFLYWYRNSGRYLSDLEQRMGSSRAAKNHRELGGSAVTDLFGIGSRFEVDATVLDIACVSKSNRNRYVGRPTLHLVTDVYSKMIVGFYLGFLNSSWEVAGLALRNVMEDKVAFCARYGVKIEESEWPVSGCLPHRILGDRGEYEGYDATDFTARTGVTVEVTPPYRGDMKGTVEKRFHMIHQILKPELPGAVAKDHAEKGDVDYRRKAILNLDELTQIIIRTILYLNNHHALKSYRRSRAMTEERVDPIPREIWNWAMRTGRQQLGRVSSEQTKFLVLPETKATISGEGLIFRGMRYRSEWVSRNDLAALKRTGRSKVQPVVSYDPNSTKEIYLHLDGGAYEKCSLSPTEERFDDMTFAEVEVLRRHEGEERRRLEAKGSVMRGQLHRDFLAMLKGAYAERGGDLDPADLKLAAATRGEETRNERTELRRADEDHPSDAHAAVGLSEMDSDQDLSAVDDAISASVNALRDELHAANGTGL